LQFNCDVSFPDVFQAILGPLRFLNLDIISSLGLECRIENYDYVDTLIGVTLGPLFFAAILMIIMGLEVAYRKYETKKLEARLRKEERFAIPDGLGGEFSLDEIHVLRRIFKYFENNVDGTADFDQFPLFQGKTELSFRDYLYTIQQTRFEYRQSEVSRFIDAAEANANARQGEYIIFSLLLFSFMILIGVSSVIFEYFQCASFEEVVPAVSYHIRDYSLNCASSRYRSYLAYAVFMVLVYPFG